MLLTGPAACGSDASDCGPDANPTTLTDTSGVTFDWVCSAGRGCRLEAPAGYEHPLPCGDDKTPGFGQSFGHFFSICATCFSESGSWAYFPGDCRIVTCDAASDCPNLCYYDDPIELECADGLCRRRDRPRDLDARDVMKLCFAELPRSETWNQGQSAVTQVDALVASSCTPEGRPCDLPEECPLGS